MAGKTYPYKRLILCCDGTWQASNHGNRSVPSNIAKISRAVKPAGPDETGKLCPQITYYDAGVGTAMGWLDKKYSGAFGEGLSENVCEAYNFLVNNYEEGDEVYVFGFSRGGYTARALAGLVASVGVCRNDMMDQFWEMYDAYCSKRPGQKLESTEWGQSGPDYKGLKGQKGNGSAWLRGCFKDVNIKVVGVFDTVGSLGWPDSDLINLSHSNGNKKYGFHDTNIHANIKNAFHALALDEKRRPFSPTLWHLPLNNTTTNLVQCWFPGVHINVGGGSSDGLKEVDKTEGDLESMANITFAWMVDRVREVSLLDFEMKFMFDIMDRYAEGLQNILTRKAEANRSLNPFAAKTPAAPKVYRGWGVGPIKDSFDSQNWVTRQISGSRIRTPGRYLLSDEEGNPTELLKPERTKEYIHPVVFHDREGGSDLGPVVDKNETRYNPPSLDGFVRHDLPNGMNQVYYEMEVTPSKPGWYEWMRGVKADPFGKRKIQIPEFRIPYEKEHERFESLERKLVMARPTLERKLENNVTPSDEEERMINNGQLKEMQMDADRATKFLKELDAKNLNHKEVQRLKGKGFAIRDEDYIPKKAAMTGL